MSQTLRNQPAKRCARSATEGAARKKNGPDDVEASLGGNAEQIYGEQWRP
jgi:hypothetical protein